VKITVDLPDDLIREVKLRAVNEGKRLKDIIAELLREGLDHSNHPPMGVNPRRGTIEIPLFPSSSDAPAGRMTLEQLVAAEHETLSRMDDHLWSPRAIGALAGCLKSDAPTAAKETNGFSQAALGRHDRISQQQP